MDAIIGTGKLSTRQYNILAEPDVFVSMSDGTQINLDIFRPDSEEKFPVLLAISAFNKDIQSDRIWPAATRSRRIHGIPDGAVEAERINSSINSV